MREPAYIFQTSSKFINNALASNLSTSQPMNAVGSQYRPNLADAAYGLRSSYSPISISDAQKIIVPVFPYPNQIINPKNSQNSRLKEVMYEQEPGASQKIRSRSQSSIDQKSNSKIVCCLLTLLLLLALLLFVIWCIAKHKNNPLSIYGNQYYSYHPLLRPAEITLTGGFNTLNGVNTFSTLNQFDQNRLNYVQASVIGLRNQINRKLRQVIIDSHDIIPVLPNGLCSLGFFLLNGVCYSCKAAVGYQSVTGCYNPFLPNNLIPHNFQQNFQPVVSTPQCRQGSFLVNGQCISCPPYTTWDGVACRKIGGYSHSLHLKKEIHKNNIAD